MRLFHKEDVPRNVTVIISERLSAAQSAFTAGGLGGIIHMEGEMLPRTDAAASAMARSCDRDMENEGFIHG